MIESSRTTSSTRSTLTSPATKTEYARLSIPKAAPTPTLCGTSLRCCTVEKPLCYSLSSARQLCAHAQPPDIQQAPLASECQPAGILLLYGRLQYVCAHMFNLVRCISMLCRYLTPPGAQGFAPHYDDIEVGIVRVSVDELTPKGLHPSSRRIEAMASLQQRQ